MLPSSNKPMTKKQTHTITTYTTVYFFLSEKYMGGPETTDNYCEAVFLVSEAQDNSYYRTPFPQVIQYFSNIKINATKS